MTIRKSKAIRCAESLPKISGRYIEKKGALWIQSTIVTESAYYSTNSKRLGSGDGLCADCRRLLLGIWNSATGQFFPWLDLCVWYTYGTLLCRYAFWCCACDLVEHGWNRTAGHPHRQSCTGAVTQKNSAPIAALITTIGVSNIIQNLLMIWFCSEKKHFLPY